MSSEQTLFGNFIKIMDTPQLINFEKSILSSIW